MSAPAGRGPGASSVADPLARLDGVSVRYPGRREPALADVDFAIDAGAVTAVAGPNGSGKSTLALVAAGFIPRVVRAELRGEATVGGLPVRSARAADLLGRAGIVFSNPATQLSGSKPTVRDELAFGLENLGMPRAQMGERLDATIAQLGLERLADRSPATLSGGEQQRVAIASILCMRPALLVLDEPTAHLDPAGAAGVADLVRHHVGDGTAVLVAEHRESALLGADRCVVLDEGRIAADGPPARSLAPASGTGVAAPAALRLAAALGLSCDRMPGETGLAEAVSRAYGSIAPERAGRVEPRSIPRASGALPAWESVRSAAARGVELDRLEHVYPGGQVALSGVTLRIEPGEAVAIVGQNGSGKTTLAKHLVGILRATSGRVSVGDRDAGTMTIAELARFVGYLFQDPDRQLFSSTVEREVAFGPRNLAFDDGQARRAVEQALRWTGLADRRTVNPYDLGLADRKLVALASVLAMDSGVLVLDEPTTGQDGAGIARIGGVVDGLVAAGRTVLAITHDMTFAARHFPRVVVLREGLVVADGPPGLVFGPAMADVLASTGLAAPLAARIAALAGIPGPAPATVEDLLARIS